MIRLTLSITVVATICGLYIFKRLKSIKWIQVGEIKSLNLYPLKSGNKVMVEKAECTVKGLKVIDKPLRDRCLLVYNVKDKEFRTARTYPALLKIDVSVHDLQYLALNAPNMRTLYIELPKPNSNGEIVAIKCWYNEIIEGIDCGDEAALWISRYITGRNSVLRLAYNNIDKNRDITKSNFQKLIKYYKSLNNNATGLFSDLAAVSILNQRSIDDLNERLGLNNTVSTDNFRGNIIVNGNCLTPYEEDKWEWVKLGDVVLRNVKECTRCVMVNIDPETATHNGQREPLQTLKWYRMSNGPEKAPVMGLYCGVQKTGILKVGDPVYVRYK